MFDAGVAFYPTGPAAGGRTRIPTLFLFGGNDDIASPEAVSERNSEREREKGYLGALLLYDCWIIQREAKGERYQVLFHPSPRTYHAPCRLLVFLWCACGYAMR